MVIGINQRHPFKGVLDKRGVCRLRPPADLTMVVLIKKVSVDQAHNEIGDFENSFFVNGKLVIFKKK